MLKWIDYQSIIPFKVLTKYIYQVPGNKSAVIRYFIALLLPTKAYIKYWTFAPLSIVMHLKITMYAFTRCHIQLLASTTTTTTTKW